MIPYLVIPLAFPNRAHPLRVLRACRRRAGLTVRGRRPQEFKAARFGSRQECYSIPNVSRSAAAGPQKMNSERNEEGGSFCIRKLRLCYDIQGS